MQTIPLPRTHRAARWAALAVGAMLVAAGCDGALPGGDPEVARVEILAAAPRLLGVGQTMQLHARAYDAAGRMFTPEAMVWNVSDASVLRVSRTGRVTSVALGSALVSATAGGVIGVHRLDVVPSYLLPYARGTSHRVVQAFGGAFSHTAGWHYSYDFAMPIGTPVHAARAGTVVHVEEAFEDGDTALGHENYIIVDHGDGTFARYLHLTRGGALARPGQRVTAGQPIARSGNTGFSTLPHLHFDVTAGCGLPLPDCHTVPYWFANATPHRPPAGATVLAR
ncbi:MAG: peptidoglycan DD-metalloendopeptidase family protein [Rhodothermales bacterium]|nr:peptidoglycan DD-metalloendopeptidase family protein [Rhodothermales bacterium]